MNAEELWEKSGLSGYHEAWAFAEAPDKLLDLVRRGIKSATCSVYDLYAVQGMRIPEAGDYSVLLDSKDNACYIIRTVNVTIEEFCKVSGEHAWKEGEGDRSLDYWRQVHREFMTSELSGINEEFDEQKKLICEEFELVYDAKKGNIIRKA